MKKISLLLGRIFLSLIFITAVANQIFNWGASHQSVVTTLNDWLNAPTLPFQMQKIFNFLLSYSTLALLLATALAGVGGVLVLLGIKVRLGGSLLILFLLPTTLIMHAFWLYEGAALENQMIHFLKNLSILGGLMILVAGGSE